MARQRSSTSAFGVSKRESHDASAFYRRFTPPEITDDSEVAGFRALDKLIVGDARRMDEVPDASVALVVTSPPYFAGKEYEEALGEGSVPADYLAYLQMLRDVFAECVRKLEPGGRIAVNVANLGRRPYRSLAADVIGVLQDDLCLLLRGEIVWVKQRGSSGSCAWGSFQRPGNPVLRDLTERVIVASKGRFDRAVPAKLRRRRGLPSEGSMTRDDFMENTLDVWEIPAESATRVGHPAPFPLELPARLIELYTYRGDLVLDPFAGSGTTAVAAVRAGRHYAGYDLDRAYVERAEQRISAEWQRLPFESSDAAPVSVAPGPTDRPGGGSALSLARSQGWAAKDVAEALLSDAGFTAVERGKRRVGGIAVDFTARDGADRLWSFDRAGGHTTHRPGLRRSEALWKALGRASVLHEMGEGPLVLLTFGAAGPGPAAAALAAVTGPGKPVRAVVNALDPSAAAQLRALAGDRPVQG